uniref:Uncharacterized protein n=1 Tax=Photinus pyralis TaxID=7054 RepID=A0A1Y1LNN6_PHOPY
MACLLHVHLECLRNILRYLLPGVFLKSQHDGRERQVRTRAGPKNKSKTGPKPIFFSEPKTKPKRLFLHEWKLIENRNPYYFFRFFSVFNRLLEVEGRTGKRPAN